MKILVILFFFSLNLFAETQTYNFNFKAMKPPENLPEAQSVVAVSPTKNLKLKRDLGHGLSGSAGVFQFVGSNFKATPYSLINVVINTSFDRDFVFSFGNIEYGGHKGKVNSIGFQRFYELGKNLSLKRSVSLMGGTTNYSGNSDEGWATSNFNFWKIGYAVGPEWYYKFVSAYILGEIFYGGISYKSYDGYYREGMSYDGSGSSHNQNYGKNTYGFSISSGFTLRI